MERGLWIIFFLLGDILMCGQGAWLPKTDFPGEVRPDAVGFIIGDKCYVGTGGVQGWGSLGYDDLWEWDSFTDTWTQKAPIPAGSRTAAVGFSIGHKGYIATGANYLTEYGDLWEYDPLYNSWAQKTSIPCGATSSASAFVIGNKAYVVTNLYGMWEWDQLNNTWTQKATFPPGFRNHGIAFTIGNKGYFGMGSDQNTVQKDFWEYDPINDIWTQKTDFPYTKGVGCYFSCANKCYVGFISIYDSTKINKFWNWDPITDAWIQSDSFPAMLGSSALGLSNGNNAYLAFTDISVDSFWEFNPFGTASVQSSSMDDDLQIFPNPTTNSITVRFAFKSNAPVHLNVKNSLGQTVYYEEVSGFNGNHAKTVALEGNAKGIYLLELLNDKHHFIRKVVLE